MSACACVMSDELETLRILIVEDNANDTELLCQNIREVLPNAAIACTDSFYGAEEFLKQSVVGLVLLDLTLPDAAGEALVLKIKGLTHVPVIVMTGDANLDTSRRVVKAGAESYIVKGEYRPIDLLRTITMCIGRKEREADALTDNARQIARSLEEINKNVTLLRKHVEAKPL